MGGEEIEVPPEVEAAGEWLKANWVMVMIGLVLFAMFVGILRAIVAPRR